MGRVRAVLRVCGVAAVLLAGSACGDAGGDAGRSAAQDAPKKPQVSYDAKQQIFQV